MSGIFKPGNTKPRVLIVDNNPEFTFRAHLFLQHTGRYPDLILLDLIMPELDGAEVAAQLGADWTLRRVPIVFLTALITPEEARHVRRIDGHRLVAKPVSSPDLVRIIEESLPSWRAAA